MGQSLWETARQANADWDRWLEQHIEPEAYYLQRMQVQLGDGSWCMVYLHLCGAARLRRELDAKGITGSQGIWGDVHRNRVVNMAVLGGPLPDGRPAGSQWGLGHEMRHVLDQSRAYAEARERGASHEDTLAAADAANVAVDTMGRGLE